MRALTAFALGLLGACGFEIDAQGVVDAGDSDTIDAPVAPTACLGAWCRRRAITLAAAQVAGGPHVDFPMLVSVTDSDLMMHARADGADLLFTDADGVTLVPYERQSYVAATGQLMAWVKVPSLTASSIIYLYYGNPAATDQARPTDAWSAYAGVWHLDELGGSVKVADVTANANSGTGAGDPTLGATGKLGLAVQFDGINDWLLMPKSASFDETAKSGTYSLWVKWINTVSTHYQRLMSSGNRFVGTGAPDGFEWAEHPNGGHFFYPWGGDTYNYNYGPDPFALLVWQHAAVTLDYATRDVRIYINGAPMSFTDARVATNWVTVASPGDCVWGGNPGSASGWFAGLMDELRATTAVRSADWIATEFHNQDTPQTFATLGPLELLGP